MVGHIAGNTNVHAAAEPTELVFVSAGEAATFLRSVAEDDRACLEAAGFSGDPNDAVMLPERSGKPARAIVGIGHHDPTDPKAYARAPLRLPPRTFRLAQRQDDIDAAVGLGWAWGTYRFDRYRSRIALKPTLLWPDDGSSIARRLIEAETRARDWTNTAASDMGPADLAALARAELEPLGARVEVIMGDELGRAGYAGVRAVGGGSARPPHMIDARWGTEGPRITLVGKGVCFDAGGLNVKQYPEAAEMKSDMAGAACAILLGQLIMRSGWRVRLRVLIPAIDNMPSGSAVRNGDVIQTCIGTTIEIAHTDNEGRVILADALAHACTEAPDLLIDFGTLTNSGLGSDMAAFFTDDEDLAAMLYRQGRCARDPVWRLPLWRAYSGYNVGSVADFSNMPSTQRFSDTIAAALFLQEFARGAKRWLHVDFEGWNLLGDIGRPLGGNIVGLRACYRMLEEAFGRT